MLCRLGVLSTPYPFFGSVPDEAATDGILGSHAIYPWELETLANELLAFPTASIFNLFDCQSWHDIADTVNVLRNLENAEYSVRRSKLNILQEMGRIGARQFEWQRGFSNKAVFYRSALIYGQGECAHYFATEHGFTVNDFTFRWLCAHGSTPSTSNDTTKTRSNSVA